MSETHKTVVQLARKSLKRVAGVGELFAVGYGDVGSSIYYTLGAVALYALGATPIALLIAGCVFICTALTYSEMSTMYPEAGGSSSFARHAFNDLISFIAGWGLLLDYLLTLAISAFTIPPYLKHTFTLFGAEAYISGPMHTVSVGIIIAFLFLINVVGLKSSGRLSLMLAIFTLVTQLGVVFMGSLLVLNIPYVIDHIRIGVTQTSWAPDWWQFWKGTAMAMVAYTGIEALSQMSAETKKPSVNIPKAIKFVIYTVLFLYVGLSFVGLSVVTPEELGTRYLEDAIGGIAMNFPVGGQVLGPWVGVTAAIILLICANAGLIGCSRLIFSMGTNYQLPKYFSALHKRFRTPYVSLFVFSAIAFGIVLWSRNQMLLLADLYNFGAQIAFFFAHLSLIVMRIKDPERPRPYKAPLNIPIGKGRYIPLTAVFGCLATCCVWVLVIITKPEGRIAGLTWMFIGILIYFLYRKRKKLNVTATLHVEQIKIPEYEPLVPKNILVMVRHKIGIEALQVALQLAQKHHAKLTAVCVLEVPESVPFDAELKDQERKAEVALKRAEAIAQEYHQRIDLEFIRSRSISHALLDLVETKSFDMALIAVSEKDFARQDPITIEFNKFVRKAGCSVLFCKG